MGAGIFFSANLEGIELPLYSFFTIGVLVTDAGSSDCGSSTGDLSPIASSFFTDWRLSKSFFLSVSHNKLAHS